MERAVAWRPGPARRITWVGGLGTLLIGLWLASRFMPAILDDSFITFRYSENLARGLGPTYNPGQPPVEGFTSPLWMLLLAVVARVAGPLMIPSAAVALGLVAWSAAIVVLLLAGRPRDGGTRSELTVASLLPAALWGLSPGATHYAVAGLETPAFALAVIAVHASAAEAVPLAAGLCGAALASWVRPEGAWLVLAMGVQWLVSARARTDLRRPLSLAAIVCVTTLLLLLTRHAIFHEWLPNTYYAKRPSIPLGVSYLTTCLGKPWMSALFIAAALGAAAGEARHRGYAAAAVVWVAAAVLEGGDWMVNGRLLQPALIVSAAAAGGVSRAFAPTSKVLVRWLALGAAAEAIPFIAFSSFVRGGPAFAFTMETRKAQQDVSEWLRRSAVTSAAMIDIGEVGYDLPDLQMIDLAGLTDYEIGHAPGGRLGKHIDSAYVLEQQHPDVILLRLRRVPARDSAGRLAPKPDDAMSQPEGELLRNDRISEQYRLAFVELPPVKADPLYARAFYVRRSIAIPPDLLPPTDLVFQRRATPSN